MRQGCLFYVLFGIYLGGPFVMDCKSLVYLIDQAVLSMDGGEGYRAGMYPRAAHDCIHGKDSDDLRICLEGLSGEDPFDPGRTGPV